MVACVNSFLQVRVAYYDYVNCFVRGNQVRISEDYGSGGYDPFEIDKCHHHKNIYITMKMEI